MLVDPRFIVRSIKILGNKNKLTRWMARVNAMGKIEKRFTAQVSGTRLVATEAEGRVQAEPRDGKPTTMRPFRLLYAMALVVLQPLPCVAPAGKRGCGYRRPQHDWPKKSTDFGGEAKGVASVWSSTRFRFEEVEPRTAGR